MQELSMRMENMREKINTVLSQLEQFSEFNHVANMKHENFLYPIYVSPFGILWHAWHYQLSR